MGHELDTLAVKIASLGEMSDADAREIIRKVYQDGTVRREEAAELFQINNKLAGSDPQWDQKFVEMVKDFLLNDQAPEGWVTEEEGEWLIEQIRGDGGIKVNSEIDLMVAVLRYAEGAPEKLSRFALKCVCDRIKGKGRAMPEDIERMRRVLYAPAGDSGVWVNRHEVTQLFLTNDAIAFARNDESWNDLFARAVGNHLMAMAHPDPVSETEAFRREAWLKDTSTSVGGLFQKMGNSFGTGSWFSKVTRNEAKAEEARRAAHEAAAREAEKVDDAETAWFMKRLGWDDKVSPAEKALVEFLKAEAPGFVSGVTIAAA